MYFFINFKTKTIMKGLLKSQKEGYSDFWITKDNGGNLICCSIYRNSFDNAVELNNKDLDYIKSLEKESNGRYKILFYSTNSQNNN